MAIVNEEDLNLQDVNSINVSVSPTVYAIARENLDPRTGLEGKFSMQYAVANALLRGDTGMHAFTDEKVNDPEVRDLMKKVSLLEGKKLIFLETTVEMETKSGDIYTKFYDIFKQIPEIGTKKTKVKDKYVELTKPVLGDGKTKDLMELILSLEKLDNMNRFTEQIQS